VELEAILDDWPSWRGRLYTRPQVIGPLTGGRSNRSFLLDSGGMRLVLRISTTRDLLPGHEHNTETTIWRAASKAGIAPPLLHVDSNNRFLVSTYVETRLPEQPKDDPVIAEKALELLQGCHRLDVTAASIDYASHIGRYWQIIEACELPCEPKLRKLREPMGLLLENLIDSDTPRGTCHHDPVQQNFVGTPEKLYLVDWEYAARGLMIMDYAAFALEWGIERDTICERTGMEPELIAMAMDLYRYQCHLWEAITQARHSGETRQPGLEPDSIRNQRS
jgi:thiamine kinase